MADVATATAVADSLATTLAACRQLLLCLAPDWQATSGRLQRFERDVAGWRPVGEAWPVMLGRNGLAWGMAEESLAATPALPHKIEGDGRAPVGLFPVTALFGYAAADSELARAARLPYLVAHPGLQCVDDAMSAHYNQVVDRAAVTVDWGSAEEMRRVDGRYELGAVVAYNQPPQPGRGSCIFLHVWEAPGVATAGCTALALPAMRELAGWLDAAAQPLLLQWPQAEYRAARQGVWAACRLPEF